MKQSAIAAQTFNHKHANKGDLTVQDRRAECWHSASCQMCPVALRLSIPSKPYARHVSLRRSGGTADSGPVHITCASNDTRIVQAARELQRQGKKCMILTGDKDLATVGTALELARSCRGPTECGAVL